MAKNKKSETVPAAMQERFTEIVELTDDFCDRYLTQEYAQLCRYLAAALCRKRPSPLVSGKPVPWACGIVHTIGSVNFLFDPSQMPHMKAMELFERFGVSRSTGQSKSKQIQDLLNIVPLDPEWCLPSQMDNNPMAWMITVNGFIIDARSAPRSIQEEAFRLGLIPKIPGEP